MFGLPDINQEILVFNLGKWSVVISRTVGIALFSIIAIVFFYFSWFYDFEVEGKMTVKQGIEVSFPWTEYIKDCGSDVIISNNLKAKEIFKTKYQNNYVNWSGYFFQKRDVKRISFIENSHAINLLIKMEPTETELQPDIVLSLSDSLVTKNQIIIDSLQRGDEIHFKGKFINIGDEFNVNHLHAISIEKTGNRKEIPNSTVIEKALPNTVPAGADDQPKNSDKST